MEPTHRRITFSLPLLLICVAIVWGCDRGDGDTAQVPMGLPDGGELVFEDSFDDDELADHWTTGFEGWTVTDGHLTVQGARNDALWLQHPLPDQFRVSFTARSDSAEGDIKFEILGDGTTHESGYVGIFGGWNNRLNIIARLDEHGDDRLEGAAGRTVDPGRTYQMDVVRTDHRLRWYVDGEPFLSYPDNAPLKGDGHRYFAFNNWDSPLTFGDLRIYDLEGSIEP